MIRYELGDLERQIAETRQATLDLLSPLSEDVISFDPLSENQALADLLIYLTLWHQMVNQGLREIKRSKKPTKLMNAIKSPDNFHVKELKRFKANTLEDVLIQLENMLFQQEEVVADFSFAELNERNQYRFFRNIRLGQFIAEVTIEKEQSLATDIALAVKQLNS